MTSILSQSPDTLSLPENLETKVNPIQMLQFGENKLYMNMAKPTILENFGEDNYGKFKAKVGFGRTDELDQLRNMFTHVQQHANEHWKDLGKPVEIRKPDYKGTLYVQLPVIYKDGTRHLADGQVEKLNTAGEYWNRLLEIGELRSKNNWQPSLMRILIRLWAREEETKIVVGFNFVLDGLAY